MDVDVITIFGEERAERVRSAHTRPAAFEELMLCEERAVAALERLGARNAADFVRGGGRLTIVPGSVCLRVEGRGAATFADSALSDCVLEVLEYSTSWRRAP